MYISFCLRGMLIFFFFIKLLFPFLTFRHCLLIQFIIQQFHLSLKTMNEENSYFDLFYSTWDNSNNLTTFPFMGQL